jgi:predicted RNA-binding protein with PIN domain
MSARFTIIDGYNLMYAAGFCQVEYAAGDLMRCRARLIAWLLEKLTPAEIGRTTVVFDAREPPPGRPDRVVVGGLTVLFARELGEADALIEQLIEQHFSPKQLTVVSSDHRLHKASRARRGEAIDSERFLDEKERRRPRVVEPVAEKPTPMAPSKAVGPGASASGGSTGSTEEWMREFGTIDVDEAVEESSLPPPRDVVKPAVKEVAARGPKPVKKPAGPAGNAESKLPQAEDTEGWLEVFTREGAAGDASGRGESQRISRRAEAAFKGGGPRVTPGEETELALRRAGLDRMNEGTVRPATPLAAVPSVSVPSGGDSSVEESQVDYWMKLFGEVSGGGDTTKRSDMSKRPKDV